MTTNMVPVDKHKYAKLYGFILSYDMSNTNKNTRMYSFEHDYFTIYLRTTVDAHQRDPWYDNGSYMEPEYEYDDLLYDALKEMDSTFSTAVSPHLKTEDQARIDYFKIELHDYYVSSRVLDNTSMEMSCGVNVNIELFIEPEIFKLLKLKGVA